jgi:putative hydrolase of the HAD superfamily
VVEEVKKLPVDMVFLDMGNTLIYFDGSWQEIRSRSACALADYLQSTGRFSIDWQDFIRSYIEKLRSYYLEREMNYLETSVEITVNMFLTEYGLSGLSSADLRAALQAMYAVSQAHWHPEDDTLSTLETLRSQGYRLGIISNAAYSLDVETLIDKAGIRPFFDTILISADIGIRKPHPKIFQVSLERSRVSPARSVMVGDTLSADILGAKNAGMYAVWITRRADQLVNGTFGAAVTADAVIDRLSQLPDVLASPDC